MDVLFHITKKFTRSQSISIITITSLIYNCHNIQSCQTSGCPASRDAHGPRLFLPQNLFFFRAQIPQKLREFCHFVELNVSTPKCGHNILYGAKIGLIYPKIPYAVVHPPFLDPIGALDNISCKGFIQIDF